MPIIQVKKFYKGFSTRNYEENGGSFDVFNVDCVEEDLLNEIFTIRGERLNMPNFGTRIPLLTFEPNDVETKDIIRTDLETVFGRDPRVQLLALDVIQLQDRNAMVAIAKLNYKEFEVTKDLLIEVSSK